MSDKATIRVERGAGDTSFYVEGDYIWVTLDVPGYDLGGLQLQLGVERDDEGDWRVWIPYPALIESEDGSCFETTGGRLFRMGSGHEGAHGTIQVGAPD